MKRLFILLTLCAIAGANASSGSMLGDYYQYLKQLQQLPETPKRNAEIEQVIRNIAVIKQETNALDSKGDFLGYGETRGYTLPLPFSNSRYIFNIPYDSTMPLEATLTGEVVTPSFGGDQDRADRTNEMFPNP